MKLISRNFKALNEAVNFELGCIFIAVPKTGTTSVRKQVKSQGPYMIANPHLTIAQIGSLMYPYLLACNLGQVKSFPTPQAIPTSPLVREKSEGLFKSLFKFGSVRNPWARTFSLYRRREGVMMSKRISFTEFVNSLEFASDTCIHPLKTRSQLDWFKDDAGTMAMDFVFKLEEKESAIREIREITDNKISLSNVALNQNPEQKCYRDAYCQETRDKIGRLFEEDIDYFGYSF